MDKRMNSRQRRTAQRRYAVNTRADWESLSRSTRDHVRMWNRPSHGSIVTARSVHADLLAHGNEDIFRPSCPHAVKLGRIRIASQVRSKFAPLP